MSYNTKPSLERADIRIVTVREPYRHVVAIGEKDGSVYTQHPGLIQNRSKINQKAAGLPEGIVAGPVLDYVQSLRKGTAVFSGRLGTFWKRMEVQDVKI